MCFTNPNKIPQCHHRDTCSWGSGRRPLAAGLARLRDTIHGQRHAVGLPALRRERLRVEAGVLQMRAGVFQIMRIVSITSAIWMALMPMMVREPGGVGRQSTPGDLLHHHHHAHTTHTDPPVPNRGSRSFWCAIDFCVGVGSVTAIACIVFLYTDTSTFSSYVAYTFIVSFTTIFINPFPIPCFPSRYFPIIWFVAWPSWLRSEVFSFRYFFN